MQIIVETTHMREREREMDMVPMLGLPVGSAGNHAQEQHTDLLVGAMPASAATISAAMTACEPSVQQIASSAPAFGSA